MEARNSLETDIYAKKEWLESEDVSIYGNEEEIANITTVIQKVSEWYEDEGYKANTTELSDKHGEIKDIVKSV